MNADNFSDNHSIYLDYAATTPTDPIVLEAMLPFLSGLGSLGNASSIHRYGREARAAVDEARESVARLVGADYSELYFTGSGTEAANLAIIGTMCAAPPTRNHFITTATEHHAVLHTAHFLQTQGFEVTIVGVDHEGLVSPQAIAEAMTDRTALVSVMHANNEIGTIQPIADIARIVHERGAKFHTDAVQTAGQLAVDVHALDCDLLSFCAHKMYGPKGIGALVIAQGMKVAPILHGGAQEREKRPGTENVAAIVGFGKAAQMLTTPSGEASLPNREKQVTEEHQPEISQKKKPPSESICSQSIQIAGLRDSFLNCLHEALPDARLNGHPTLRLPNNVNISVPGVEGPTLLMNLDRQGVAASSGSACSSGSIEPSHVLKAIGLTDALASSGVRFSLGKGTTAEELESAAAIFIRIVRRLWSRS